MMAPRWQKVFKDLTGNRTRTVLVVLSILVGAFCVGLVSDAYTVMLEDINNDYELAKVGS